MPASVQRLNESNDVIKYWKHDMSCMKMICDYKVHREPLSTVGEFIIDNYMIRKKRVHVSFTHFCPL